MNVASLELCRELYELSGWQDTDLDHNLLTKDVNPKANPDYIRSPLYDFSYLLKKLRDDKVVKSVGIQIYIDGTGTDSKVRHEVRCNCPNLSSSAETAEDALALLAIELFKNGSLPPKGVKNG